MIAIISDVHANLEALEAVLCAVEDAEAVLCCGDVVGYGPQPNECCELLRDRGVLAVKGNHDHTCATLEGIGSFSRMAAQAAVWTHRQLTREHRAWLNGLPLRLDHGDVSIVHGCPGPATDMLSTYVLPEWLDRALCRHLLGRVPGHYLVLGHTHVPMGRGRVLNPGSVGLPRDGDWRPAYLTISGGNGHPSLARKVAACVGLADPAVEVHRVAYDWQAAARRLESGMDVPAASVLTVGAREQPAYAAG